MKRKDLLKKSNDLFQKVLYNKNIEKENKRINNLNENQNEIFELKPLKELTEEEKDLLEIIKNSYSTQQIDISNLEEFLNEDMNDNVDVQYIMPSLIGELIARTYPNLMMKNFVGVKTINKPSGLIPYIERHYKTAKNGIITGADFTGLPDGLDTFNPFYTSEWVISLNPTKIDNIAMIFNSSSIAYEREDKTLNNLTINFDENTFRKIMFHITFLYNDPDLGELMSRDRKSVV